jgi:enterochelin esterase-like enzyme
MGGLRLIDAADQQIHTGSLLPMIIVLPQGDRDWWTNHTGNGPKWGDYVINDLVPHIDRTYRTLRDRSARAIGGVSMGGWGALQLAFNHPRVFSVVGAIARVYPTADHCFPRHRQEFANKDPLSLARTANGLGLQIWLDAGEQDPWLDRTVALHQVLQEQNITHFWNLFPGGHDWHYWQDHVLDYLQFYGHALSHQ